MVDSHQLTLAEALATVSGRRAMIERELGSLEKNLMDLRTDLREAANQEAVLRSLIESRAGTSGDSSVDLSQSATADAAPVEDWSNLSRKWVVREAVAEITRTKPFASPGDIEALLATRNRSDDKDNVGAALSYLRKRGEVVQLGRAQWGIPSNEVNR